MRYLGFIFFWAAVLVLPSLCYGVDTVVADRDGVTTPVVLSPAAIGAATSAQGAKADSALQPTGNGSQLTGITASQVGAGFINIAQAPYNAVADGTAVNTTAINNAIAALPAQGGTIYFPWVSSGIYKIDGTITVAKPVVFLGGVPTEMLAGNPQNMQGVKILWGGGAAPMFSFSGQPGVKFEHLILDGNNAATYDIYAKSWTFGGWKDFKAINATVATVYLGSASRYANDGSMWNTFEDGFLSCNAGRCLVLDGDPALAIHGNVCHNLFERLEMDFGGDYAMYALMGDNNTFLDIRTYRRSGTGKSVYIGPNDGVNTFFNNNFFYHVQFHSGMDVYDNMGNSILGYDRGNGQPAPTLYSGARLMWTTEGANSDGWHFNSDIWMLPTSKFKDGTVNKTLAELAAGGNNATTSAAGIVKPDGTSITVDGDGTIHAPNTGSGSVTSVSSANADIGVTNSTTTPTLTLNSGNGPNQIPKLDASSRLVLGSVATPAYELDMNVASGGGIRINAPSGPAYIKLTQAGVENGYLQAVSGAGTDITLNAQRYLNLKTNGTTRMQFQQDGTIGFGGNPTIAGTYQFMKDGGNSGVVVHSAGGFPYLTMYRANGTLAAPTAVLLDQSLGEVQAAGHNGSGYVSSGYFLKATAAENWDSTHAGFNVSFATRLKGTTSPSTDKMVLWNDGSLQLGGTFSSGLGAGNLSISGTFIAGYTALTDASATISTDTTRLTVTSTTARTLTLPATLPAGTSTANITIVSSGAIPNITIAAASGGTVTAGDAGWPTYALNKRQRLTCVSENSAATTTAAWDCYQAGGTF